MSRGPINRAPTFDLFVYPTQIVFSLFSRLKQQSRDTHSPSNAYLGTHPYHHLLVADLYPEDGHRPPVRAGHALH